MFETVVDACCVINLCAIDDHRRWLQKLGLNWQVPSAVFAEAMYLNDTDEDGARFLPAHSMPLYDWWMNHL